MSATQKQPHSSHEIDRQLDDFMLDRKARNLSANTIRWYEYSLAKWRDFIIGQNVTDAQHITPNHLRRFIINLGRDHNEGGVVHIFGAARGFLKWYEAEYAPHGWENPLHKVKQPKKSDTVLEPLEMTNFHAMLGACNLGTRNGDRDRAILLTLLDTGLRKLELANLLIGDVNLNTGDVLIRKGKGRKSRTVFVGVKTRRALRNYLAHRQDVQKTDPLWTTPDDKALTYDGIRQVIRRLAARAGVKEPGLHDFRRAFAVNSLRSGMDVLTLQRLLGHADLRMINQYVRLVYDDLRESHRQHGVVDKLV